MGGAYASSIEFEYYIDSQQDLNIGDALIHYQLFDRDQVDFHLFPENTYWHHTNGVYYVYSFEKSKNVAHVVAYDAIKLLDVDYSDRLVALKSSFPMSCYDLLQDIISYTGCGITIPLFNVDLRNTNIEYFYVDNISARSIVSCIAELNGDILQSSTSEVYPFAPKIKFASYSTNAGRVVGYPRDARLGASGYIVSPTDTETYIVDGVERVPVFYKENSIEVGSDEYEEIDCVKAIKLNGEILASYDGGTENNIYYARNNIIVENISTMSNNALQKLYSELRNIDATPAVTVELFPFHCPLVIGGITYFVDLDGTIKKFPVMKIDWEEDHVTVQSFGASVQDYSEYSYQNVENQNTTIVSVLNKLSEEAAGKVSKSGDTMTGALNLGVPLAIASGGTGATTPLDAMVNLEGMPLLHSSTTTKRTLTASNRTAALVFTTANNPARCGAFLIYFHSSTANPIVIDIAAASGITTTVSAGKVEFTVGATTYFDVCPLYEPGRISIT